MSYSLEYQRFDSNHLLIALPAALQPPPRQGDTLEAQISWFVGSEPPASFFQPCLEPQPPSGHHLQHPTNSWTFALRDTRYFIRKLTSAEPKLEPERLPVGPAASSSTAAEAAPPTRAAALSSSAASKAGPKSKSKGQPGQRLPPTPPAHTRFPGLPRELAAQLPQRHQRPPSQVPTRGATTHSLRPQVPGHRGVDWVRYVDVLPVIHSGEHYESGETELFRPAERTVYRLTTVAQEERQEVWELLRTGKGLPCEIVGKGTIVDIDDFFGEDLSLHLLQPLELPDGPASLLLSPLNNTALQPQAAVGESSYGLNGWAISFRSNKTREEKTWHSCGRALDYFWEDLFHPLAQVLSIEGAADQQNHRMVYAKKWRSDGERLIHGIGVRVFDGGARFELKDSPDGNGSIFKVPGESWAHKAYGTFTSTFDSSMALVKVAIPPAGYPQDLILRITADLSKIKYAVRPREGKGAALPISRDEWKLLRPGEGQDIADEWVECFFVNLRRVSRQCKAEHLLRPSQAVVAGDLAAAVVEGSAAKRQRTK